MKNLTLVHFFDHPALVEVPGALDMYIADDLLSFEVPGGTVSFIAANVEGIEELGPDAILAYLEEECDCAECNCDDGPCDEAPDEPTPREFTLEPKEDGFECYDAYLIGGEASFSHSSSEAIKVVEVLDA